MTHCKSVRVALAAVAMTLLVGATGHGWGFNHENIVKFTGPVALPGVVLPAGTYSFDVASPTALDVVVVRSADRGRVYYTGFTRIISRPRQMSLTTPIAFAETPANQPPAIAAWYEVNDTMGHEFVYR
jgi:hypothetical protein